MTVTPAPLRFAWGSQPDTDDQYEATASTSEDLRAVLDRIHADALARGLAQQVDVWAMDSTSDPDDDLPDPFLQFLLGHPERASLRWLSDEGSFQATDPALTLLHEPIRYDRGGTADDLKPEESRLTRESVAHILDIYLNHGERAQDITWSII
jgi:hypothetical protein